MQTNAQIIRQANARVVESWGELAKEVLQRVEIMREEVTSRDGNWHACGLTSSNSIRKARLS